MSAHETVQSFLATTLGKSADLADDGALRQLLSEADARAASMRLEVVSIIEEERTDVDSTLAFAEQLQTALPAMLHREADPHASLQAELQGSLLKRQELTQQLHTLEGVTSALHALAELHGSLVVFAERMEARELSLAADSLLAMRARIETLHAHLDGQARAAPSQRPPAAGVVRTHNHTRVCAAAGGAAGAAGRGAGRGVRASAKERRGGGVGRGRAGRGGGGRGRRGGRGRGRGGAAGGRRRAAARRGARRAAAAAAAYVAQARQPRARA